MAARLPIKDAVSAGGVIWRKGDGGIEVVLCGRRADGLWMLPKGTPDPGETMEQTAIREAQEETGLTVTLGEKVGSIDYWFVADGYRWHKWVHHWLMEPTGGSLADHDQEFDDVEWFASGEALALLKYEDERRSLQEALKMLEEGRDGRG